MPSKRAGVEAQVLARLKTVRATTSPTEAANGLADVDARVRFAAVKRIQRIGARAANHAEQMLSDAQFYARNSASEALAKIGAARNAARALQHDQKNARLAGLQALELMKPEKAATVAEEIVNRALTSENAELRIPAKKLLEKIGDAARKPLTDALGHENPIARKAAADTLAEIGTQEDLPPLLDALAIENDSETKRALANAVSKIKVRT